MHKSAAGDTGHLPEGDALRQAWGSRRWLGRGSSGLARMLAVGLAAVPGWLPPPALTLVT